MVYLIPQKELKLEDVVAARQEAIRLLSEAIRARGKRPEAYVVRDVLPKTDLGLANEEWRIKYSEAYKWELKIDRTLPEDNFIAIFGVQLSSRPAKTLAIKLYKDVTPIEVVHVEKLFAYQEPIGFFTPLVWSESEAIKAEFYGNAAGDDLVVLRGLFAELRKKTIA